MRPAHCLIVAKAPVAGQVKTRLGAELGMAVAADLAAAALLDTLDACRATFGPERVHVAITGTLARAARGREISAQLQGWSVFEQVGETFAQRLAAAHSEVGRLTAAPTVQIGMDTPQVTEGLLRAVAAGLDDHAAVVGDARDGGWWVLALRDPADAVALTGVPMSTPYTGARTREALRERGLGVGDAPLLRDVDTVTDARAVAVSAPGTRFSQAWSRVERWAS